MQITGRLTEDAKVATTSAGKQVVNFSIADNDSYKPKGSTERKETVTYFRCAYWVSPKVAEWLKKGMTVLLTGSVGANAYINMKGEAVANLTFKVDNIKVLVFPAKKGNTDVPAIPAAQEQTEADVHDDLPF